MSLTNYDNMKSWAKFWSKLPLWLKGASVIVTIIVLSFFFVHYQGLRQKNSDLKDEIAKLQNENRHLETMTGPIQEITKRLYPNMETVAAIAKLSEDIENVRSLATRDVHKPLAKDRQEKLIAGLKALRQEYSTISPSVKIHVQIGSSVRGYVGADLKKYLHQAGWSVDLHHPMLHPYGGTSMVVRFHPEDEQFLRAFDKIIDPLFIKALFDVYKAEEFNRGHLEITIIGDPLFNDSGVVTFK